MAMQGMGDMKKLVLIGAMFVCHPLFASTEVSICNQAQVFLEVTDGDEVLDDAATGECLTLLIPGNDKSWLINFGMTRYLFDFTLLRNCMRDGKARLVASPEGRLYCDPPDQEQPRGFPLEATQKIDLI
jgi:hypothetical protein